jgi:hypothetical protein
MRKVLFLAAVVLSASFATTSPSIAAPGDDLYNLNKNTHMLMRDLWNPYAATAQAAAPAKVAKKKKMKKKKSRR